MVYRQAFVLSVALVLVACSGFPRNQPGDGFGHITISSPRIEGRERLINERREQEAWLRKQLEKVDAGEYGVSGEVDLRSMSLIASQIGINRDPALKLDDVNRQRQLETLRQAADDERALGTFRAAARDQILADYKDMKITAEQASDALKKLGYDMTVPKPPTAAAASAPGVQSGRPDSLIKLADLKDKTLTPEGTPRRATVTSTPIEAFQDRLAAREVVRNELNDVRLDDLHDLHGRTLYRLTFNAEVLPQDDASAWAVVRLKAKVPFDDTKATALLTRVQLHAKRQLDARMHAVLRTILVRMRDDCLKQEIGEDVVAHRAADAFTQAAAFRRAIRCASSDFGSRTRGSFEQALMEPLPAPLSDSDMLRATDLPAVLLADLVFDGQRPKESSNQYRDRVAVQRQWAVWLGSVIARHATAVYKDSALYCIDAANDAHCGQGNSGLAGFKKLLKASTTGSVYSVTPKETVQRLSEVSSNRKVTEFLLNVNAVSSVAGIGAALQNIQSYDAFYSALRRQPLVVGVTESGSTCQDETKVCAQELIFGWVLGPSFQMSNDGKSVRFRHSVVQRSVAAELVLPAWLDHIELEPEVFWVRESGVVEKADHCRASAVLPPVASAASVTSDKRQSCPAKTMVVQLPARPLAALDAIDVRDLREPRVDAYQYLDVVIGEKASVLITGQHLWRSTEILLGAQRADLVTVLPDSSGVVATFDKVLPPLGADKSKGPRRPTDEDLKATHVYLRVVTSEGQVEAGRVAVRPAESTDAGPKVIAATGAVPRVVAGVEHIFELSPALKPTDSALILIGSSQDVTLRVPLDKTTQIDERRDTVRYSLAATNVPNLKSGSPVDVDLQIRHADGSAHVVRVVSKGTYYEKETDAQATAGLSRAKQDCWRRPKTEPLLRVVPT